MNRQPTGVKTTRASAFRFHNVSGYTTSSHWMRGALCAGLIAGGLVGIAPAAENEGITVVGVGKVEARPSIVEMSGTVVGDAELAGDAVTKYHGNRQGAVDAISALGIEGLTIDAGGISIKSEMNEAQMQAMRRGMPAPGGSNKLSVSEPLKLRLEGVDKMDTEQLLETIVKIVDAGKDAGVLIGPKLDWNPYYGYQGNTSGALATFKLDKVDEFKGQAYEKAIADARKQAERLAELAGVKLGPVTGIREGAVPKNNQQQVVYAYPGMVNQQEEDQFASTDLKEITVSIVLQVDFAIIPPNPPPPR